MLFALTIHLNLSITQTVQTKNFSHLAPKTWNMSQHETHNQEILQSPTLNIIGLEISWQNHNGLYSQFMLWKQKCKLILDCQLECASDWWKATSVLQWSGNCGLEIYNSWGITDTQHNNLKEYWRQLTAYYQPHANSQHVQFDLWHNSAQ